MGSESGLMTRRSFVAAGSAVAASTILYPGCVLGRFLVPVFEAVSIEVIAKKIVDHFSFKSGWVGGETMVTNPPGIVARTLTTNEQSVLGAFKAAYANSSNLGRLASPVLDVRAACGGKIAFMQKSTKNSWLVSGYQGGVYNVAEEWVKYLIERNSCDLIIDGHTQRNLPCSSDGCTIRVSSQNFRYFDGRKQVLNLAYPSKDEAAMKEHDEHTTPFKGCPEIKM